MMDAFFQELLHFDSPWSIFTGTLLAVMTYAAAWMPVLYPPGEREERKEQRRRAAEERRRRRSGRKQQKRKEQAEPRDLNELMGYEFIRRRSAVPVREDSGSREEPEREEEAEDGRKEEREQARQPAEEKPEQAAGVTIRAADRTGRNSRTEGMMTDEERERERQMKANRALNERMERERRTMPAAVPPEEPDGLPIIDDILTEEEQEFMEAMHVLDGQADAAMWSAMTATAEPGPRPRLTARQIAALTGRTPAAADRRPSLPTAEELLAVAAAEADISREMKERERGLEPSMRDGLAAIGSINAGAERTSSAS